MRLKDKRVVITGGTTGIGAAVAARFLTEGAKVSVWGRQAANADSIKAQLPALDVQVVDVADPDGVDRAFSASLKALGGLDVLICNAGISQRRNFVDITREEFDRVMRVNVHGAFYPSQLAARHMLSQEKGGAILMTASTAGVMAYRHYSDYNASKGAMISLMRSMALELAPKIRVNAVNPGYTMTPMQEAEYTPEQMAEVNGVIPLKRHARPEEMASLYVYLASDESAYASGAVFTLDGAESIASGAAYL